ncbi:MAG: Rap1a/Tai family immunity protein [Gammaproteobacteria bacterium]
MRKLLFVLLFITANTTHANYLNGAELLNHCVGYLQAEEKTDHICPAFIAGITDVHVTLVNWGEHRREWCPPEDMKTDRLVSLVTRDLMKQAPESLIYSASSLVAFALVKLFPCQ